nr:MAG TPA: YopX protein [Caudoviricetes sp.]
MIMKDRYLFKAKHFEKWHIGNIVKEPDGLYIRDIKKNVMAYINDESTICQCTGLKDKNGKLIWENDIVNCLTEECCGYIGWNESEAGFYFNVLLEDGRFEEEHIYDYQDGIEVIGNIFDNPELLGIHTQNDLERHWLEKYTEENDREKRD